jgi:hypothetical protein
MKILFLHGWQSVPGGVKPSFLQAQGHVVLNPALDDEDFAAALATAQAAFDAGQPEVIVGSSRGGALAMNLDADGTPMVLLCPAWKRWGAADRIPRGTRVLHSTGDEVIPFSDSVELIEHSGLPRGALLDVGRDHRLADPESLQKMLEACKDASRHPG